MDRGGRPWVRRQTLSQLGRRPSLARQSSSTALGASPPSRAGQRPGLVRRQSRRGSVFGAMNFTGASSGGAFGMNRRKLSTREEATVREVFDLFDEEGSGCISRDEVGIVIQSLLDGDTLPENDLRAMVNLIDKDKANQGYSSIYFEDFRTHLEYVNGYRATLDADPSEDAASPPLNADEGAAGGESENNSGVNAQVEARLREHWLKLAGIIAAAAHAVGEAEQRGSAGTLGAFRNYRTKRQHNKDAQQKRLDLQHNEVVSLFRLRRLSVNAVGATPKDSGSSGQGTATSPVAFARRGLSLSWRRSTTRAAPDLSTGKSIGGGGDGNIMGSMRSGIVSQKDWVKQLAKEGMGPWNPESKWRRPWNVVIVIVVCLQTVYVPFLLAFRPSLSRSWQNFEHVQDAIFLADICFTFNTALPAIESVSSSSTSSSSNLMEGQQRDHTSRFVIACHYLRGWFLVDFVASVPIELVASTVQSFSSSNNTAYSTTSTSSSGPRGSEAAALAKAMRVPKLLRLLRMARLVRAGPLRRRLTYFFYYSNHANTLKLVRLLLIIVMIGHYLACAFYAVAGPELWFRLEDCPGSKSCYKAPAFERYVTAYYTIFLLINGEETRPRTDAERSFAVIAILVGSVIVATIFGNVSIIIMNFSANESAYRRKMESLYENMHHLQLPQGLKERIVDYYDHMWRHYRSLDGSTALFLPELNSTLGSEVLLYMRTTLVTNAPFFAQCSPMLTKELVLSLKTEVYLKGDYIVHKGMPGREMYFISRGKCEVTNNFIRRAKNHEEKGGNGSDAVIPSANTQLGSNAPMESTVTTPPESPSSKRHSRRRSSRFVFPRSAQRRGSWIVAPSAERRLSALRADVLHNLKTATNAKGIKTAQVIPNPTNSASLTGTGRDEQEGSISVDTAKGNAEVAETRASESSGAEERKVTDNEKMSSADSDAYLERSDGDNSSKGVRGGHLMAVERVLRVLPRGSYFGEAALLSSARRGGNVRARAFCEVQTLTRASFEAVLSTRPEERRVLKALLLQSCSQTDSASLPQLEQSTIRGQHSTASSPHASSSNFTDANSDEFKRRVDGSQDDATAMQVELGRRLAEVEKQLTGALAKQKRVSR